MIATNEPIVFRFKLTKWQHVLNPLERIINIAVLLFIVTTAVTVGGQKSIAIGIYAALLGALTWCFIWRRAFRSFVYSCRGDYINLIIVTKNAIMFGIGTPEVSLPKDGRWRAHRGVLKTYIIRHSALNYALVISRAAVGSLDELQAILRQ